LFSDNFLVTFSPLALPRTLPPLNRPSLAANFPPVLHWPSVFPRLTTSSFPPVLFFGGFSLFKFRWPRSWPLAGEALLHQFRSWESLIPTLNVPLRRQPYFFLPLSAIDFPVLSHLN